MKKSSRFPAFSPSRLTIVLFCGILALLAWRNFPVVQKPMGDFLEGKTSFTDFTAALRDAYTSDGAAAKGRFLDLNGLYHRVTLRRLCNDVLRLSDGSLTQDLAETGDVEAKAENTAAFAAYTESLGIPFLYVQAPYDLDIKGEMLPVGAGTRVHGDTDRFVSVLREREVPVLDLREEMNGDAAAVTERFYRSDHHWKPLTALTGAIRIAEWIQEIYPDVPVMGTATKGSNWTTREIPKLFLGSRGKRVGRYFGGMDDLQIVTPNFDTQMTCAVPSILKQDSGTFEQAVLRPEFTEYGQNLYRINHYSVYIGGQYPYVSHRNLGASADLRVLMVGDSFSRPVESFLSAMFTEVDVMDPRQKWDASPAEVIARTRPDAVVMLTYPGMLEEDAFYQFKEPDPLPAVWETVYAADTVEIPADGNRYNVLTIYDRFEGDTLYTLSVDAIETDSSEQTGVSLMLTDIRRGESVASMIFDTAYCSAKGNCAWTFRVPENCADFCRLDIAPGIYSHSAGYSARWRGLRLEKGVTVP